MANNLTITTKLLGMIIMFGRRNCQVSRFYFMVRNGWASYATSWAPTSYKYGYNSTYWGYSRSYPFIRPFAGVITPFIASGGPILKVCVFSNWMVLRDEEVSNQDDHFPSRNAEKSGRTIWGLSSMAIYHSEKTFPIKAINHHQRTTVFHFFQLNFYKTKDTKVGSLTI